MLKIRRIHLVNAGYEEATFDGESFDFRDPDQGDPSHCVLHAENGTGKTTALGLIFSLPVPKETRFLPHLVKPDYQFADYFPRGVGVVAIEWHDPAGRHPVTVHFAVPQFRGSERQTWRRWVLFRAGPGLGFEDLPLKGLAGRVRTSFGGRDDAALWLREHEERFADSHDFEAASTQEGWRQILERHGIDTHLMDSQVEFNRQEGGLDSFLKIPNEQDFIAKFLGLCLVSPDHGLEAMAEPVCAQVRAIVARMQGYDKLVAKRALLIDLSAAFKPFAGTAQAWREQRQEVARTETRAASVRQAAMRRADAFDAEANEAEQAASEHARRLEELKADASQAELAAEAARLALAEWRERAASAACAVAIDVREAATQAHARLSAARALRDILAIEAEIAEYEQALLAAEREAAEPARRAHAAGATLSAMLSRATNAHRHVIAREQAAAQAAETERDQARASRTRLVGEITAAQRRDSALEERIATAEAALAQLRTDGIVRPGETISAAITRLESERNEAEAAVRDAMARTAQQDSAADAAMHAAAEAEAWRREKLAHADAERRQVEKADQSREELVRRNTWQEYLGASLAFGPDAAATAQQRARDRMEDARRAHARADLMRQDADRITRHRVAAVDRNIDLVITRLTDAGFRSTIAAATWLADIVGNQDLLRAYAAADPAAFAGVFVQDPAELARVPGVDFSGLALDRPVAILPPTEQPGTAVPLAVVPDRNEAYDIGAAEALVEDLSAKVGEAEIAAGAASTAADALTALKTAIEAWIADWGGGRLEASQRRVVELQAAAQEAEIHAAAERRRAEEERKAAVESRSMAQRGRERAAAAEQGHRASLRWQRDQGDPSVEWRIERTQLAHRLADLGEQEASAQARADAAQQRAEQARAEIRENERAIAELAAEAERIEFRSGEPDEGAASLGDARALYRASADVLRRLLEDRLGPLQSLLAARRQDLSTRNDQLRRDHGALADDRPTLTKDAADAALEQRLIAAREAENRAREAVGRAQGEADRLASEARRQRAAFARFGDPGSVAYGALAEQNEAALEAASIAAETTRRTAELEAHRTGQSIAAARDHATRRASEATRLRDRAQLLPDRPAPLSELPDSLNEVLAEIRRVHDQLQAAKNEQQRRERALVESYDAFRREARRHPDRALEAVLVDTLISNEPEPAGDDAERLQMLLADRIATIDQEIDEYEADKNRAVGEMDGLLLSAVSLFRRAVERGVVPAEVPRFGGKRILTMTFRPPPADAEGSVALRRNLCERVLIDYVAANEVPQTDHAMAAALLERYARSVQLRRPDEPALGLRLLKSNDQGRIHHLPVAAFKASGGETLTSAMLLYLLVARLRSEGRASRRARIGGVLILDNPLGKASNTLFLRMQLALAREMDVQLIFTTAVKDWAAVGEFPQVVKLRKETTDPATGRIFVKATHQWIGEPDAAVAMATDDAIREAAE